MPPRAPGRAAERGAHALTIKGTISASTITGSTITGSTLSIGNDFSVTTAGKLTARSATFEDSVTIDLETATTFNYWRRSGTIRGRMQIKEPTTYDHLFLCTQYTGLKLLNSSNAEIQARNYADTAYTKMVASEFLVQSARGTKKNVRPVTGALSKLATTPVYSYLLDSDPDNLTPRYGVMVETAPANAVEPTYDEQGGIRLYSLISMTIRAIQEMAAAIPALGIGSPTTAELSDYIPSLTDASSLTQNPALAEAEALKKNASLVG